MDGLRLQDVLHEEPYPGGGLEEASVEVVPPEHVVSNSVQGLDLNINICTVADTEFASDFVLEIIRDCELTAIVG